MDGKPLGLYLHIPFCVKKCAYCDFYSITDASLKADYTAALIRDIKAYGERCSGYTVDTVYIGGGTPTCLGAGYLSEILQAVGVCFAIAENAEITVECNPESTDQAVLEAMHKYGVNRLSFGVQAAHDTELKRIGRIHDFAQAQAAVQLATLMGMAYAVISLVFTRQMVAFFQLTDPEAQTAGAVSRLGNAVFDVESAAFVVLRTQTGACNTDGT